MKTKTLNKNIRRSITGPFGRFMSIFSLVALGGLCLCRFKDVWSTEAFQSDVYMIARLSFKTMQGLSPYDLQFTERSDYYQQKPKNLLEG